MTMTKDQNSPASSLDAARTPAWSAGRKPLLRRLAGPAEAWVQDHPSQARLVLFGGGGLVLVLLAGFAAFEAGLFSSEFTMPWWGWSLALFVATFCLGIVAVLGGVGGGVLFVPIIGGFFPFHVDFVRGAGLLVALAGALAAGPALLRTGLASLKLAMPMALIASSSAIAGAMVGLALPTSVVQTALGLCILSVVVLLSVARKSEFPEVRKEDALAVALGIKGLYYDHGSGNDIEWRVQNTLTGMLLFVAIGFMAGMFGLGAGWANVPVLNLLMGAPLKVSVATSSFMLSIVDSSAAWVYLNKGAVLAIVAVPSIVGMMLGAFIGVRLLQRVQAAAIRRMLIVLLAFAGSRALLKGLGIWL